MLVVQTTSNARLKWLALAMTAALLLARTEAAAAEVLASPFRLVGALDAGLPLTAACEVEAGADTGADAGAEPEAGAEADATAAGAMAVADVLRELAAVVVKTGAACCLG
ncbi:unnamed protein product [Sphagnum tenellum]